MAVRAGSQVTILHQGNRPLAERTRTLGIDIRTKTKKVTASAGSRSEVFEADMVVHAAGRLPELADLNLPAASVEADSHGVIVNSYLQSRQ